MALSPPDITAQLSTVMPQLIQTSNMHYPGQLHTKPQIFTHHRLHSKTAAVNSTARNSRTVSSCECCIWMQQGRAACFVRHCTQKHTTHTDMSAHSFKPLPPSTPVVRIRVLRNVKAKARTETRAALSLLHGCPPTHRSSGDKKLSYMPAVSRPASLQATPRHPAHPYVQLT